MKRKLLFKPSSPDVPAWFMKEFLPWFERITIGYLNETLPDPNWDETDSPPSAASIDARYYTRDQIDALLSNLQIQTPYINVVDQKTNGTAGGTFTSGAWRTRDLQTVRANTITGASVSSNQIVLPEGDYIIIAQAPANLTNRHKAKLYNASSSTDILIGGDSYAGAVDSVITDSFIGGPFSLTTQQNLEIQHRCETTSATTGFGNPSSFGVVEIYTQVQIWKIA